MAKKVEQKKQDVRVKLSDLNVQELTSKAKQIHADLTKKKLEQTTRRPKNIREIFNMRKELARVKTLINVKMKLNSVKS